jgi:hypothetical protein
MLRASEKVGSEGLAWPGIRAMTAQDFTELFEGLKTVAMNWNEKGGGIAPPPEKPGFTS